MADEETSGVNTEEKTDEKSDKTSNLENFITHHYEKQKEEGRFEETDEIDNERTNNFFSRAIQESRRMNKEIDKCKVKSQKLHDEFGTEKITEWRTEHAAEVLLPEQAQQIELAQNI